MPGCAVACCTTYSNKTKGIGIIYHTFPRDPTLQKLWISKCKRKDSINVLNARVCSQHFTSNDYARDLQSELLGLPPKRLLKPDAVPTVNIPSALSFNEHKDITSISENSDTANESNCQECVVSNIAGRSNRCHAREVRKRAFSTLQNLSPKKSRIDQAIMTDSSFVSTKEEKMAKYIKILEARNKRLNSLCIKLNAQNRSLRNKLNICEKNSRTVEANNKVQIKSGVDEVLGKLLTQNQIRCLMSNKAFVNWDKEDICKAITLRAISKKCYVFLRSKIGWPLPSIPTLKKWTRCSLQCRPGILKDVLQLMKSQAAKFSVVQRICAISFDEMNVDSRISYDQNEDRIVGPHANVQTVMVRGLFSNWKQPIFFGFDIQMNARLLNKIVSSLEDASYNVVAIVADLGGKNRCVWNQLNVTETKSFFYNPSHPQKRIWVFADVPHLYKLLRNHFIDDGFNFPGGENINKGTIEKLLTLDSGELKLCHKLSHHHLLVKGRERQRVYLAMQLFSQHTAKAIHHLMPEEKMTVEFFQLINDSFDILNARNPIDNKKLAQGFGTHFEEQDAILKKLYTCINGMRCGKSKNLLPFQKGFLMTINSLFELYKDMMALNMNYILTARLNQDCLENFFSQIRGIGRFHDHPLPTDVKYRIRLLLLGTNISDIPLSNSAPVTLDEDTPFLTSQLLNGILPDMSTPLAMIDGDLEIDDVVLDSSITEPVHTSESDCPHEAFRYLAGYVAYRGKNYDASLGTATRDFLSVPQNVQCSSGWIETLSRGGLLVPTDEWIETISQFELMFIDTHGHNGISKESNVIKNLCSKISHRFPNISKEIIKIYVRTRTFIRLRNLNIVSKQKRANEAEQKKARKWNASRK